MSPAPPKKGDPAHSRSRDLAAPQRVVLFDGVCGLCDAFVQYCLKHDKAGVLHFAPLQGPTAARVLARHNEKLILDTVYLVEDFALPTERLRKRSDAALTAITAAGGPWRWLALLRVFPTAMLDMGYSLVAKMRYSVFGKHAQCMVPSPEQRRRFLD